MADIPGQIEPLVQEDRLTTPIWYEWFLGLGGSWKAYTPTVTALGGTFTSATATGRYKVIGKTVFVHVTISIVTIGTGNYPVFTLPVAPRDLTNVQFYGYERGLTARVVQARATGGAGVTTMVITNPDNSIPSASGSVFELTSVYEAA